MKPARDRVRIVGCFLTALIFVVSGPVGIGAEGYASMEIPPPGGDPGLALLEALPRGTVMNATWPEISALLFTRARWAKDDMPIRVAFLGGDNEVRRKIMAAARKWEDGTTIRFDFGPAPETDRWNTWSPDRETGPYDVRISFSQPPPNDGHWSLVGQFARTQATAKQATMNLEGFVESLPSDWERTVLHEFGHALGAYHEQQHPEAKCDSQMRWGKDSGYERTVGEYKFLTVDSQGRHPGLYLVFEDRYHWDRPTVDRWLKTLPSMEPFEPDEFDPSSIMKYYIPPTVFLDGERSPCYAPPAADLSQNDRDRMRKFYSGRPEVEAIVLKDRDNLLERFELENLNAWDRERVRLLR